MIKNIGAMLTKQQAELGLQDQFANTWQTFTKPFALMQFPSRKETEQEYLAILKANEEELKRPFYAAAFLRPSRDADHEANPFIKSLFPATQQIGTAMFRVKGQQEATSTAIAIYRFQKQNGKLPNALDELMSQYLSELPIDQFDGQPLRYQRQQDSFVLYSIGYDRTDNGGIRNQIASENAPEAAPKTRPEPTNQFNMSGEVKDIDWVLWPRLSKDPN